MFSDPAKNIAQFHLNTGNVVADLGAGSGFYTFEAARAVVGSSGKVYAIDIQTDLLSKLKNEAQRQHLMNIEIIVGDLEKLGGTKLRDSSCDRAIISNVLFQAENKKTFIAEVRRILKPKGQVLFIDWSQSFGGMGPQPEHVLTKAVATELFTQGGFTLEREISAGAHHYGIIWRKQ